MPDPDRSQHDGYLIKPKKRDETRSGIRIIEEDSFLLFPKQPTG
jgi:hypothetical protein